MLHATPQERLALGVVALLLSAGAGLRLARGDPPPAEWSTGGGAVDTLQDAAPRALREESERQAERDRHRATPLAPGERIDPNAATADDLDRLPRVGPALAERIVEWRAHNGPFRSLADFDRVPGVGPALLETLAPLLALPAAAPERAAGPLDLNRATAAELEALPGIGPALAERLVAWRREHGPFRSTAQLEEVPGIGPALRRRLEAHVRVRP